MDSNPACHVAGSNTHWHAWSMTPQSPHSEQHDNDLVAFSFLVFARGGCEHCGHLHIKTQLGQSHVGSNDSNHKIAKASVDVHKGEHP